MPDDKKLKAFLSNITRNLGSSASNLQKVFARCLYEDAHIQDIKSFDAAALADAAKGTLEFFKAHRPGRAGVKVHNHPNPGLSDVTLVQISNDDMPFLLDSVLGALNDRGLEIRLVLHPIMTSRKTRSGAISEILPHGADQDQAGIVRESMIQIYVERIERAEDRASLEEQLKTVLDQVRMVVTDWKPMQNALRTLIQDYQNMPPPIPVEELAEALEFLQWLLDDHFTLMGTRIFEFTGNVAKGELNPIPHAGLGLMRDPDVKVLRRGADMVSYTPELEASVKAMRRLAIGSALVPRCSSPPAGTSRIPVLLPRPK